MKRLIAGLGNPGPRYEKTRHNLGRILVDRLRAKQRAGDPDLAAVELAGSDWRPWRETYMNELGGPLANYLKKNGVAPPDLLVVYDELDLDLGVVRVGTSGSSAGHKGVQSIIDALGTDEFARIRLGIGTPEQRRREVAAEAFVLQNLATAEEAVVAEMLTEAERYLRTWARQGTFEEKQ